MLKNSKKKLRKLGAFSLVLAQVAAVGVVAPMTSASAFAGSAITRNMENLDRGVVADKDQRRCTYFMEKIGNRAC